MSGIIFHKEFESLFIIPLLKLPELATHKQEFFTRKAHHKTHERAQSRKLIFVTAELLIKERFFTVYHFVVRDRQNIMLRKSVHHRKREFIMIILSEKRIGGYIRKTIVHPTHIPLIIEPESSVRNGARYVGISRRLLGNHYGVRVLVMHGGV